VDRLVEDMEVLSAVSHRFAGSEGERAMLHAVRARLPEGVSARTEGFVAHTSAAFTVGLHCAALLALGVLGYWYPLWGALLVGVVTVSLISESTGGISMARWVIPRSASYNLVARDRRAQPLGAVVISAPLDTPRWRPRLPRWVLLRRPMQGVVGAAALVMFLLVLRSPEHPWGPRGLELYLGGLAVLALALALGVVAHRRVGPERTDASGPAVVLELMRRFQAEPVDDIEIWYAFTGCSRAFQGGMRAFLQLHRASFPETVLVTCLDDPAAGSLGAVVSEGSLWPQHHRPTGPALVERLRWAGVLVPAVDLPRVTGARAALVAGYRALAIAGAGGRTDPRLAQQAADVAETAVRWFAEDLTRVAHRSPGLERLAAASREELVAPVTPPVTKA